MIDTKALRSKVLDLAIQGKLTEQLESDGTAEELFAQIQEEKQRLIKEGKIKKEKPLPPVDDEEIPFEIPNNWKLVRFSDIIKLQSGQDLTNQEYNDNNVGIPYITGASNYNTDGSLIINRWTETPKAIAGKGDILISCKGTVGKITILQIEKVHIARQIMGIRTYYISNVFVEMYMQSVVNGIKNAQKGLIPGIERNDILSLAFCLPPLAEQKRIVERVEEIFKLLDIIDEAQAKYSADVETLKSKLITMGIQGKLTEQLESDETAEELFAQIQKEKQTILQSRKGRKDNSIIPIDSKTPFILPENWKWIRFGETGFFRKGPFGSSLTRSIFVPKSDNTIKVYEQQHAIQKNSTLGTYYITKEYFESSMRGFEVCAGDIIVSCAGTIGETYIMPDNIEKGIINQALMRITLAPSIDKRFFLYYFNSNLKQDAQNGNGSAITNIPPFEIMKNWYFPLPPLAEQKRIADKLDEILRVIG